MGKLPERGMLSSSVSAVLRRMQTSWWPLPWMRWASFARRPLQENVDKWRAEDKAARETQLKTNSWWMGYLGGQLENGKTCINWTVIPPLWTG